MRKCTEEEEKQRTELFHAGYSDRDIAHICGRDHKSIYCWRKIRGLIRAPIVRVRWIEPRVRPDKMLALSIDALTSKGGSFADTLVDDSWSDWLLNSGATVWQ